MATNFPASLDSLTNPSSSDSLNSPSHSAQHANSNDAIEALQAKVGADSSAVTSSLDYKIAQLEAGVTGGKILQVVQTAHSTEFSTTSTSFVDVTGLAVTITPTDATSKVLVMVNASAETTGTDYVIPTVFRGGAATGTNLAGTVAGFGALRADSQERGFLSYTYLDSPATTSATTYNVAVRVVTSTGYVMRADAMNTITVMEVSA